MESPMEDERRVENLHPPTALIIGIGKDAEEIVTGITKTNSIKDLVGIQSEKDLVESFKWTLDNKYYMADITLSILKTKSLTSPEFAETVEAVILYVDSKNVSCLAEMNSWLPYIKDYNSSITMLVCQNCSESSNVTPSSSNVRNWCLDNEFELVELEPLDVDDPDDSDEDNFHDVFGMDRISLALHAHMWPNLIRKERSEPTSFCALKSGGVVHEEILANSATSSHPEEELEDKISQLLAGVDVAPDLAFGDLFQELANMKERMGGMDSDRRKKTAEQIVIAFWKGIGGDKGELDLSEAEEDK